jgi:hypothetical protein
MEATYFSETSDDIQRTARHYIPEGKLFGNSSIRIATRLQAGRPRNRGSVPSNGIRTGSGAHPTFYVLNARGCFLGVKRLDPEAVYSPLSGAEVKNRGAILPNLIRLHWRHSA